MPKNAQQLIEGFVKTDHDQQVEQVKNIRRASFAIDKLAAQIAVVEDDERFPVERKQDSFNLHKFARALDTIVNQTGKESPNEKQIDKAVNTMAGIDIAGLMSKTFDKETADLIVSSPQTTVLSGSSLEEGRAIWTKMHWTSNMPEERINSELSSKARWRRAKIR